MSDARGVFGPLAKVLGDCTCPDDEAVYHLPGANGCPLDGWMDMGLEPDGYRHYKHSETKAGVLVLDAVDGPTLTRKPNFEAISATRYVDPSGTFTPGGVA